jgi:hypothetical protein
MIYTNSDQYRNPAHRVNLREIYNTCAEYDMCAEYVLHVRGISYVCKILHVRGILHECRISFYVRNLTQGAEFFYMCTKFVSMYTQFSTQIMVQILIGRSIGNRLDITKGGRVVDVHKEERGYGYRRDKETVGTSTEHRSRRDGGGTRREVMSWHIDGLRVIRSFQIWMMPSKF